MGNSATAVGFGQHPTFRKPRDYEAPEYPHQVFPSIKPRSAKEEDKWNALGNADHGDLDLDTD